MPKLILASASPRRKALLEQVGIVPYLIIPADIDETPHSKELPARYVERVALEKAKVIAAQHPGDYILSADTVVACGRRILPKAENDAQVQHCLALLSGRQHTVLTAVCVMAGDKISQRLVTTKVAFKRLSPQEIQAYLTSNEGIGKAGGYAIQGRAGAFVRRINGSYSSVVGLPLCETGDLLAGLGFRHG